MPNESRPSGRSNTRFVRKLHWAFGAMLLITLALAWYFYDSVEWYEHDVQQIARSNQILQNYQSLAGQTSRLLAEMNRAVAAGAADDAQGWRAEVAGIGKTVEDLRHALAGEAAEDGGAGRAGGLTRLAEIERVLNPILEAQAAISAALQAEAREVVADELGRLHGEGRVALFEQMVDSAIDDQAEFVTRSQRGAIDLAGYITGLLPMLMAALIGVTLFIAWLFTRSLTRSVRVLHDGATAFGSGDLGYRIPDLREVEFRRLGEEFNTMARELAEHRARLDDANIKLEAVVEERTRALKTSNEKLAAIDDNRRQLLADISHEFRTPLTVIQGEAEIALRGTGKSDDDYRDSLRRILEQSRQTTRLVDDLLFIARAEVGESRLDLGETAIADVLDRVCDDFTSKAESKGIRLNRRLPDSRPVLFADSGRLRQVFSILIDNALKYSASGQEVDVALENGTDAVTVTVSDRGIGLSEEELKHVFLRFYRSKKAEGHDVGTGLGLPVAKAIVEAHGGEISLESRAGGGITSRVRLPLDRGLDEPA